MIVFLICCLFIMKEFVDHILLSFKQCDPSEWTVDFKKSSFFKLLSQQEALDECDFITAYFRTSASFRVVFDEDVLKPHFQTRFYALRCLARLLDSYKSLQKEHLECLMEKAMSDDFDGLIAEIKRIRPHANHPFLSVLLDFQKFGFLNKENFNVLWKLTSSLSKLTDIDERYRALKTSLDYLKELSILNEDHLKSLFSRCSRYQGEISRFLISNNLFKDLKSAKILKQEYAVKILQYDAALLQKLSDVVHILKEKNALTAQNLELVFYHPHIEFLCGTMRILPEFIYSSPQRFSAIADPANARLLGQWAINHIWHRVPPQLWTEDNFIRLTIASRYPDDGTRLLAVRDAILGINRLGINRLGINQRQSTHTASVHRSVSKSAKALRDYYGRFYDSKKAIELYTVIKLLPKSFKTDTANRAVKRIFMEQIGRYADPESSVSLYKLLILAYLAIRDDSRRMGTFEDAMNQLVEGLYEIQRGYNLNDQGVDNMAVDSPICPAGSFNKIIEKLQGIHPDVELLVVTPELANLKFPKIVKRHLMAYLEKNELASDWLEKIRASGNSIEPIWSVIRAEVEKESWEEFQEAFSRNPEHTKYKALIDAAQYISLSDVELEQLSNLSKEKSFELAICPDESETSTATAAANSMVRNSFWAEKNASAKEDGAQEEVQLGKRKYPG